MRLVKVFIQISIFSSCLCVILSAEETNDFDETNFFNIEEISDQESFFEIEPIVQPEAKDETFLFFSGALKQDIVYGVSEPSGLFNRTQKGIEKINSEIFLQAQSKLTENSKIRLSGIGKYEWGAWASDHYSLGDSKVDLELNDLFFDIATDSGIWIRIGNQIIARGEIESAKITDVINPVDLSAPGQVELKDIRMQVPALFVSSPLRNATLELILTNNAGADKLGSEGLGSAFDFSILDNQILSQIPPGVSVEVFNELPDKAWEVIGRVNYKLNGGDISFTLGEINANQKSIKPSMVFPISNITYGFDRVKLIGLSGNLARDDYLLKYDAALRDGNTFPTANSPTTWIQKKEIAAGFGLEYTGIQNTVFSAEFSGTNILDFLNDINRDATETGFLFQARWVGFNELLSVTGTYNRLTGDSSSTTTIFIDYDLTDDVTIGGGLILYDAQSNDDFLYNFKDQDVVKTSIKYSF